MSLETPILLPSTITEDSADKVTCRLCRRQFSKYTCPTCNIPYCSLTCFRNESHSQCSETFYRKEVESDIRTEPSKTTQERMKMMELLKRFEEESVDDNPVDEDDHDDEDEDEEDELVKRLRNVDINTISSEALWALIPPEERTKFMKALDDPSSEIAQRLLASDELERQSQAPWWEAPSIDDLDVASSPYKPFGVQPKMMSIPSNLVKPIPSGPALGYNMCAICVVYTYITRYFYTSPLSSVPADSPDYEEMKRVVSKLVPFLTERRSTTLYSNVSSMITDIWSRFEAGSMTASFLAMLLRDTGQLLRPQLVTASPAADAVNWTNHPHRLAILVLSDLSELFQSPEGRPNHVTHKLLFYAAHILSTPSPLLTDLSNEILERSRMLEHEAQPELRPDDGPHPRGEVKHGVTEVKVGFIEEL